MLKPITHLRFDNSQAICRYGSPIAQIGTPVFGKGRFGTCLLMNGTNNRFDIGRSWGIPANGNFCLETWFYTTYSSSYTFLISTGRDSASSIFRTAVRYDTPGFEQSFGSSWFLGSVTIPQNVWRFLVVDRCDGVVRLFYDGALLTSQAFSNAIDDYANIKIGSNWSSAEYFQGGIDEIRFSAFSRYRGTNFKVPRYPLDSPSKLHSPSLIATPSIQQSLGVR